MLGPYQAPQRTFCIKVAEAAKVMQKMASETGNQSGTTNLGALLKAKLDKPENKE